jgi:hypothetical protein
MMHLVRFRHCAAPALALTLAGCAIHPLPENFPLNFPRASTFDIVQNVRCELKSGLERAVKGRSKAHIEKIIAATSVGYDFQFIISEDNNADAGGLDFTHKTSKTRTLSLGLDAGTRRKRTNTRTLQILERLADVQKADCSTEARANLAYPISGSLGVDEVVRAYLGLGRISDLTDEDEFKQDTGVTAILKEASSIGSPVFAEHLRFKTVLTAGATPTLTLTAVVGSFRVTNATLHAQVTRNDHHSLIIGFAQDAGFKDDEFARKAKEARSERKLFLERGRSVVRGARAETALAQGSSEYASNRLALELSRLRNLVDDEQDEARFLGQQLLKALRPPDEAPAGN